MSVFVEIANTVQKQSQHSYQLESKNMLKSLQSVNYSILSSIV